MLAPIIDIATIYSLLVSPTPKIAYVWLGFLALQMLSAAYAFRLDGEPLGPCGACLCSSSSIGS